MNNATLAVLRCPKCKGTLKSHDQGLLCVHDELLFPIRDGMPIMLIEQATHVKEVNNLG